MPKIKTHRGAAKRFSLTAKGKIKRSKAFANIKKAAQYYHVNMEETNWHSLGKRPHTKNPAHAKSRKGK